MHPDESLARRGGAEPSFRGWFEELERRYASQFEFAEIRRAVQAISWRYVEERGELHCRSVLDTRGKRAAYALYYGPLHFLAVREVVTRLGLRSGCFGRIVDLGCGTGAGGAAWATACRSRPRVFGIDVHPWCLEESAWTYRYFRLDHQVRRGDLLAWCRPEPGDGFLAAYVIDELTEDARSALLSKVRRCLKDGGTLLIIEPISRRISRWMEEWEAALSGFSTRLDDWRFQVELPDLLERLDQAAGLRNSEEITCRTLLVKTR
ncbi:MAG: hypothetical protein Kow00109_23110 [Acidobacteriota bacterium]